jgi:uncharacterized protein (TIGR02452 family)
MSKESLKQLASRTLALIEQGHYSPSPGQRVELAAAVQDCRNATRLYSPQQLLSLQEAVTSTAAPGLATRIDVVNETTLRGIAQVVAEFGENEVVALNFASARNPGGGFLNGMQAQEESLARSSALYVSQLEAMPFYEDHRASRSLLYSDAMILSPRCPVICDDAGKLLPALQSPGFITSAAPNAGAIATQRPDELPRIELTLRRRAALVLALAASQGYRQLVLGAWGCGVFRNDPELVAAIFSELLSSTSWAGRFRYVRFSVLDSAAGTPTFRAFDRALAENA